MSDSDSDNLHTTHAPTDEMHRLSLDAEGHDGIEGAEQHTATTSEPSLHPHCLHFSSSSGSDASVESSGESDQASEGECEEVSGENDDYQHPSLYKREFGGSRRVGAWDEDHVDDDEEFYMGASRNGRGLRCRIPLSCQLQGYESVHRGGDSAVYENSRRSVLRRLQMSRHQRSGLEESMDGDLEHFPRKRRSIDLLDANKIDRSHRKETKLYLDTKVGRCEDSELPPIVVSPSRKMHPLTLRDIREGLATNETSAPGLFTKDEHHLRMETFIAFLSSTCDSSDSLDWSSLLNTVHALRRCLQRNTDVSDGGEPPLHRLDPKTRLMNANLSAQTESPNSSKSQMLDKAGLRAFLAGDGGSILQRTLKMMISHFELHQQSNIAAPSSSFSSPQQMVAFCSVSCYIIDCLEMIHSFVHIDAVVMADVISALIKHLKHGAAGLFTKSCQFISMLIGPGFECNPDFLQSTLCCSLLSVLSEQSLDEDVVQWTAVVLQRLFTIDVDNLVTEQNRVDIAVAIANRISEFADNIDCQYCLLLSLSTLCMHYEGPKDGQILQDTNLFNIMSVEQQYLDEVEIGEALCMLLIALRGMECLLHQTAWDPEILVDHVISGLEASMNAQQDRTSACLIKLIHELTYRDDFARLVSSGSTKVRLHSVLNLPTNERTLLRLTKNLEQKLGSLARVASLDLEEI
eukprot:TRINITY_DN9566_c0_g1_i1.p1 TRINITY_DN9566_c0_g1~~TRINITY_DN9566_c0_g1_i1.p1  ORF type:complete len:689 (+),score=130.00 TRINITY_DN9566_c0_g1_i1:55-2121(+)